MQTRPIPRQTGNAKSWGRLMASCLLYGIKHPLFLLKRSHVTNLIIKHYRETVAHQGRGLMINELRSKGYWIISCSSAVSSHIFRCVHCR